MRWHCNEPRRPRQNPKVERSQGTAKRWAEPGQCAGVAELQARLKEADRVRREEHQTRGGGSRRELFPALQHSGRRYSRGREERAWSLKLTRERRGVD